MLSSAKTGNCNMRYYILLVIVCVFSLTCLSVPASAQTHEITFCGEKIPVDKDFVAKKLMDIIRQQIPYVNLAQLRKKGRKIFPGSRILPARNRLTIRF